MAHTVIGQAVSIFVPVEIPCAAINLNRIDQPAGTGAEIDVRLTQAGHRGVCNSIGHRCNAGRSLAKARGDVQCVCTADGTESDGGFERDTFCAGQHHRQVRVVGDFG